MPKRPPPSPAVHPILVVTRRTGLSADVVRAWERRHGAIAPARTQSGRRLYSDADVERLRLLAKATLAGRTIGQVAGLSDAALVALVDSEAVAGVGGGNRSLPGAAVPEDRSPGSDDLHARMLHVAMACVDRYDAVGLDLHLRRATVTLSAGAFLDLLVVPLSQRLEERVREGTLRAAQRHLANEVLRRVLDHVIATTTWSLTGPSLVVATPTGQAQELGALVTAAAAAQEGWRVAYLGPGRTAEDVADTVLGVGAPAAMLSLGAMPTDRTVPRELRRLRALLPSGVAILVEGAAAEAHRSVLTEIDAAVARDLDALRTELRTLSAATPSSGSDRLGASS